MADQFFGSMIYLLIHATNRFLRHGNIAGCVRLLALSALAWPVMAAAAQPAPAPAPAPAGGAADQFLAGVKAVASFLLRFVEEVGPRNVALGFAGLIVALAVIKLIARWNSRRPIIVEPAKMDDAEANLYRRYRDLFENANDLIFGTDLQGRILYANTAWQESLDIPAQEVAERTIFNIIHSDFSEGFAQTFRRAAAGIKIKNIETTFVSKFGKRLLVEGSLHCELVNDEVVGVQCIFRDITERKKAASELKLAENRFARIFAVSPIAIGIASLADGRFQDVNDSFGRMLGYDRREVVGATDAEIKLWNNPADRENILNTVRERQTVRDMQCRLRGSGGITREALISAELIELNGEQCVLFMIHDNTERLNLESQLRQAQKMEGIGQLAAGVAHDFNNILTIIQGHAGRLHNADGLPPKIAESVEQVSVAADRAATLTRQLLTFCRKQAMVPEVIDLNQAVRHATKMLGRNLGDSIHLDVREAKDLPSINADPGMIELCILNMANNSRDAMPKGGRLTISTSLVNVTAEHVQQKPKARVGQHVCLTVTDTGTGMDAETLRRIFEPFFTTKEVGKGTGLGLATVHGIIEQHRGWIEVSSTVGKGTVFKIYLPAVEAIRPAKPAEKAPEKPVKKGKETILLVDDEVALREMARFILEQFEYRVLEAGSGPQALVVWEKHKDEIDMLLTDMVMPEGMTGRDLAERIQAERPGLKVLYSSGYSPDVVGGHFKLPENSFFLPKPYHPPKLAQMVRDCLDHEGHPTIVPLSCAA